VVYTELSRRKKEISYVKTPHGFEVDFLIHYPGEREELVQVCADIADDKTLQREIRALDDAGLPIQKQLKGYPRCTMKYQKSKLT
jgi:predicted AAA+ superfamily ATPase